MQYRSDAFEAVGTAKMQECVQLICLKYDRECHFKGVPVQVQGTII